MVAPLASLSNLNANFAMKYLLRYTEIIHFMLFFIFIVIKFSILSPVDTLNLAVGCSPSYVEYMYTSEGIAIKSVFLNGIYSK